MRVFAKLEITVWHWNLILGGALEDLGKTTSPAHMCSLLQNCTCTLRMLRSGGKKVLESREKHNPVPGSRFNVFTIISFSIQHPSKFRKDFDGPMCTHVFECL